MALLTCVTVLKSMLDVTCPVASSSDSHFHTCKHNIEQTMYDVNLDNEQSQSSVNVETQKVA